MPDNTEHLTLPDGKGDVPEDNAIPKALFQTGHFNNHHASNSADTGNNRAAMFLAMPEST
jgi:hypothetical protein